MVQPFGLKGLTAHLVFAIVAASLGSGFQHGYNTGVVNAPEDLIKAFVNETFHYKYEKSPSEKVVTILFSIIVSVFCLGGLVGALITAFLSERFGRRGGLLINNALVIVAAVLLGFGKMAYSFEMLIVGRFIIGVNAGLNAGIAPMYLTEISPTHLRGAVGTIYQLIITISILISQIFGLPQILGTHERWPILFGLIIIPCIFMFVTLPICPETPKFVLINQGKDEAAQKVLAWLRGTDDVNNEMDEMRAEYEESKLIPNVTLREMVTNPVLRRPFIIAIVIMLAQQFSGINAIIFYSTGIFQNAGLNRYAAIYATLGIGVINVLMTVVSMLLVEKAGRKTLLLFGLGGMMIITLLLTIFLALTVYSPWLTYFSVVCVIIFIIMFASGLGSIPWFLVTELFSQGPRAVATSIAVAVNWLANFIVSLGFLPLQGVLRDYVFLVFTVLLGFFWFFTYNQVPETKGRRVEEITAIFKDKSFK